MLSTRNLLILKQKHTHVKGYSQKRFYASSSGDDKNKETDNANANQGNNSNTGGDKRDDDMIRPSKKLMKFAQMGQQFADRFEEIAKMKENPKYSNNSNDIGENRPLRVQDWERINKQWDDERRAFRANVIEPLKPKMYTPSAIEKRILLWSGMFTSLSEMPEQLNSYAVNEHWRSILARVAFFLCFIYSLLYFIYRCDEMENKF